MRLLIWLVLFLVGLPQSAFAERIPSRFGEVTLTEDWGDCHVLYKGRKLVPDLVGNNCLSLESKTSLADRDLLLIRDSGGVGCPAMFYILDLSTKGIAPTLPFGSCSEEVTVTKLAKGISVSMTGFAGPNASAAAAKKEISKRYLYKYEDGKLTGGLMKRK